MNKHSSSYEEICSEENQLTIYKKCLKSVAIMMYKVKTGTAPEYIKELFISQESPYDMRDNDRYVLPKFRTITYGKKSFRYFGAWLWGNIPTQVKSCSSLNTFKSEISKCLLQCAVENIQ